MNKRIIFEENDNNLEIKVIIEDAKVLKSVIIKDNNIEAEDIFEIFDGDNDDSFTIDANPFNKENMNLFNKVDMLIELFNEIIAKIQIYEVEDEITKESNEVDTLIDNM